MSTRPGHLPDFTSPPLIEVALGVQFTPLENLQTLHGGIIWEAYKDKYPYTKELPPLPHVLETFGRRQVHSSIPFKLSLQDRPDVPRYWFISENNDQLIQIQKDRFLQNWRKESSKAEYPRYESIREDFFSNYKTFCRTLADIGFAEPDINQCEITYINEIEFSSEKSNINDFLCKILRIWKSDVLNGEPELENIKLSWSSILKSKDSEIGRLHTKLNTKYLENDGEAIRLQLTARGMPSGYNIKDIEDFFDFGREEIVNYFTKITTDSMHEIWGRKK